MPYKRTYDDSVAFDEAFVRALNRFLETRLDVFTPKDALEALNKPYTEDSASDVYDLLTDSPLAFRLHYDFHRERSQWLTRAGLFQGKEFAVKISKMEIAAGIFIPGLRCSIFANMRVATSDYRFYNGRKLLPQTVVDVTLDEVEPFYALAGEEFVPQVVAMDSEESSDADIQSVAEFAEGGSSFPLKVVDMREFYWHHQIKPGDYLVFKVVNWRDTCFSVRVRKQGEEAEGIAKWREAFWQLLDESFEDLGPWVMIETQVTNAFFLGYNKEFFTLPPDDMLNAIELSPDIDFLPFGMETRLWKEGEEFPIHETWELWLKDVLCGDDTDILDVTNFPIVPEVLYAFVQDAVWRDELHPYPLVERLCAANGGKTTGRDQVKLMELVNNGYRSLAETYNIFEDTAANLRATLVNFYTRIVSLARFCQAAGAEPLKLNEQHILVLTQFAGHVVDCLRVICYTVHGVPADEMPPDESIEGMEDILAAIEESLMTAAENYRSSKKRKGRG